jgi:hypothetical protein
VPEPGPALPRQPPAPAPGRSRRTGRARHHMPPPADRAKKMGWKIPPTQHNPGKTAV